MRTECFLCDKALTKGHLDSIRNAIKVQEVLGPHIDRVKNEDYLCLVCHEKAAAFKTFYDAWKAEVNQIAIEHGCKTGIADDDSFKEYFDDGQSPREAFEMELSYWDDDK